MAADKRDELTNEKEDLGPVENVRKRMNRTVSYHRYKNLCSTAGERKAEMNINPSKLSVWDQPEAFLVPTADSNCDVRDDKMVQNPHSKSQSPKWRADRDIISTSRWT